VAQAAQRLAEEIRAVSDEGIQPDFSYYQHGRQLYSAGYGGSFPADCATVAGLLDGMRFALPRALYDEGVRRYGFHGLSYDYIAGELARRAPHLAEGRVIVAHLGNGASMCALQNGRSMASTMGFTALDGLPMGTRCGQVDPGVLLYLMDQKGMTATEISDLLYRKSGLLGLSGLSNDMRTLEAADTAEAAQAIDYFVFRCQRELGGLAAALGGIDALIFCGGIGENSRLIRARICERLGWMGIVIDPVQNAANAAVISSDLARTTVMVIPTNEELVIARAARAAVGMAREVAA
jgi:acetate kinase